MDINTILIVLAALAVVVYFVASFKDAANGKRRAAAQSLVDKRRAAALSLAIELLDHGMEMTEQQRATELPILRELCEELRKQR